MLSWGSSTCATIKQNFTYGTKFPIVPTPTSRGSLAGLSSVVSVTCLENSTPLNNPPSPVPNLPNDPDYNPDPNFSDYYSSEPYDFSEYR